MRPARTTAPPPAGSSSIPPVFLARVPLALRRVKLLPPRDRLAVRDAVSGAAGGFPRIQLNSVVSVGETADARARVPYALVKAGLHPPHPV